MIFGWLSLASSLFAKVTGIDVEALAIKAGVALVVVVGAYIAGIEHQKGLDQSATLRVQLETARQDVSIAKAAADTATQQNADLEASDARNKEQIDALQSAIASEKPVMVPDPKEPTKQIIVRPCNVDSEYLKRMRQLR